MKLGKLIEVDIRKVWQHEQYDFSAWLAKEENIQELGSVLNLNLSDVETEKFVGSYRCDIICKDEYTGKSVLIENQLEPTNHDHLGKIITYASGLDAAIVIWIVASAKEEHASAIEWLNRHTDDDLSFFLVEVHAYKIADSLPAPQFKIIEQPNDFAKTMKAIAHKTDLNDSQLSRLEFWTQFNNIVEKRGKPFNKRKADTRHSYDIAIGSSECHLCVSLVNKDHKINIVLWIGDNKELFNELHANKTQIEQSCGLKLTWSNSVDKKSSTIGTYIHGLDFDNTENYPDLMNKIIDYVLLLRKAFAPYIK